MAENEKNTFKKEEKTDAEFLTNVRTEDTLLTIFLMNCEKKFPTLTYDQFMSASGKQKLQTPLITSLWKFSCNIKEMIAIAKDLKEIDGNYSKIIPKLKEISERNQDQRMHFWVLTTKEGAIIEEIKKHFPD